MVDLQKEINDVIFEARHKRARRDGEIDFFARYVADAILYRITATVEEGGLGLVIVPRAVVRAPEAWPPYPGAEGEG